MENKKIEKKWIFLLIPVAVAVVLMIIAVSTTDINAMFDGVLDAKSIRSVVIFMVAISLCLIALTLVLAFAKPDKKPVTADIGNLFIPEAPEKKAEEEPVTDRFCMLSEIESKREIYQRSKYDNSITLEMICENFRNYAASRLKLYYDIADIRKFVAGMAAIKHI